MFICAVLYSYLVIVQKTCYTKLKLFTLRYRGFVLLIGCIIISINTIKVIIERYSNSPKMVVVPSSTDGISSNDSTVYLDVVHRYLTRRGIKLEIKKCEF